MDFDCFRLAKISFVYFILLFFSFVALFKDIFNVKLKCIFEFSLWSAHVCPVVRVSLIFVLKGCSSLPCFGCFLKICSSGLLMFALLCVFPKNLFFRPAQF